MFHDFPDCWMHPLNSSFRQRGPGREKGLQDFCSWRPFDSGHCEFGFVLSFVNLRRSNGHRKIAHYEAGRSELWVLLLRDTSDFSRAAASKKVILKFCLWDALHACWHGWHGNALGVVHHICWGFLPAKSLRTMCLFCHLYGKKGTRPATITASWWLHTMCFPFKFQMNAHGVQAPTWWPFEPMLGISKEPRAGSYGAGTEGAIIGRGVVSERVSNVCFNSHTCQQQTASAGSGWGLGGHSSPQSIPLLHPRMTMVIHWKLTKKIEYSFRFAWTPADHEECDDGYEDCFD